MELGVWVLPNNVMCAHSTAGLPLKAKNPLSFATEIIIEIKQFNPGRMAPHPFIASNRMCMVFPPRVTIENAILD